MKTRKREKFQLARDGTLGHVACVAVHAVPFVDRHHHRPPALQDEPGDVRVLVRDLALRIHNEDRNVGPIDGLQGLYDGELLDAFEYLPAASQSGRVDEDIAAAVHLEPHVDPIAPGARLLERHDSFLTDQSLDAGGFSAVGAPYERSSQRTGGPAALPY